MSSGDSCLASLSAIVMEDIYKRHIEPEAEDRRLLRVAQGATLVTGTAAAVCALAMPNISDLLVFVYDFWTPAMIVPFMVGLFWYHESRIIAAVLSMVLGMISTAVWRFGVFPRLDPSSPWRIQAAMFGLMVALVTFFVLLPLTKSMTRGRMFQPRDPRAKEDRKGDS
jgi:SSS family solute:Na+ symporter